MFGLSLMGILRIVRRFTFKKKPHDSIKSRQQKTVGFDFIRYYLITEWE